MGGKIGCMKLRSSFLGGRLWVNRTGPRCGELAFRGWQQYGYGYGESYWQKALIRNDKNLQQEKRKKLMLQMLSSILSVLKLGLPSQSMAAVLQGPRCGAVAWRAMDLSQLFFCQLDGFPKSLNPW